LALTTAAKADYRDFCRSVARFTNQDKFPEHGVTLPDNNASQFLKQQPKAGDTQPFPSGKITYLAPLPLPTQHPAQDYSHAVGELNDTYLDFGTGLPQVFGWQVLLGLPFIGFVM